ncbi:SSI family serine proteinase inhibitor [Actinokineospora enzanensis]|uniref:SSI family serine proteinase inhibitor n=1 Tax=Actinokineospora enzanensis TaxID=155975 RepID=UPI000367C40C|nr:SSI family serine proteinase inhibitor [Actinokineospora enzanensis]
MSTKSLAAAAACAVLAALLPSATAAAEPPPGIAPVHALFVLSVSDRQGNLDAALLECAPDGGTHPDAGGTCAALSQVNGDFSRLPGNPGQLCTMEYAPVTATAHGIWGYRFVQFRHTYGNRCQLEAATGVVFKL